MIIARRSQTCLRISQQIQSRKLLCRQYARVQRRCASTSSASGSGAPAASSPAAQIAVITNELDKLSPRFDVPAESIEILRSPSEFYDALKTKIEIAQHRIYLATLYFGAAEYELVGIIKRALQRNPQLKVSILTDALRGTREAPEPTCASLLTTLLRDFGPDRVQICMFHTPNLTGVRKSIVPKRINEGWGLQHMKLYGIDDEIIMSGANLSSDYFTNRQDRYHVFKSNAITTYFSDLHRTVCDLSYQLIPSDKDPSGFVLEWPGSNTQPAPLADPKGYIASATKTLRPFTKPPTATAAIDSSRDTHVYPLVQLTPLLKPDTSTELPALTGILARLGTPAFTGSKWTFTAGYFNMTTEVRQLLLRSNPSSAAVVAASPWANGFYGSKGLSGMLPGGYTFLSRRFLDAVAKVGLSRQIALKEWRRGTVNTPGGWSYHAKGIWITLPGEQNPSISLVGSSNYTQRSYSLDLEANTLIVTRNADLQKRLGEEESWLQEYATPMTRDDYAKLDRRVGLHVRIAMWIVTLVGGAL